MNKHTGKKLHLNSILAMNVTRLLGIKQSFSIYKITGEEAHPCKESDKKCHQKTDTGEHERIHMQ